MKEWIGSVIEGEKDWKNARVKIRLAQELKESKAKLAPG